MAHPKMYTVHMSTTMCHYSDIRNGKWLAFVRRTERRQRQVGKGVKRVLKKYTMILTVGLQCYNVIA